MPKPKYDPVLGQHIADFMEWHRTAAQDIEAIDALQQYGRDHGLSRKTLYDIARYLEDHDWTTIDASVLSPDFEELTGLEEESVFDRYLRAIKEKRYEDAHKIFESMAPSEQQVIKDRRATVLNKLYKIAQKARQEGWQDIVIKIATLWDDKPGLLAASYGALLEELADINARIIAKKESPEALEEHAVYAKELEITKKQMEDLMKERGVENPVVSDAAKLIAPETGLDKFKAALAGKNYEEARDLFAMLSPEEQAKATELARQMFAVAEEVINLHKLGADLFAQGKYIEAAEINDVVQACLPEMEIPEGQQLVLLVIDPALAQNLPQAFAPPAAQGPPVEEVLNGLRGRALPGPVQALPEPECPGCSECGGELPQTFNKVVELANLLDDKGHTVEADKLDSWLTKIAEEVKKEKKRSVKQTKCEACGTEMYYTEGTPRPRYCRRCLQDPWAADKIHRGSIEAAKKDEKKEPVKITKCEMCGVEMYYRNPADRPRWCPQCLKGPWAADKVHRGSIEAAKKKKKSKPKMKEDKPAKVIEIADAIRRDDPKVSDEKAYRMAWETYCSYVNPGYSGCTPKGKSKRKSPKPYSKAATGAGSVGISPSVAVYIGEKYQGDMSLDRAIELEAKGIIELEQSETGWVAHKKIQPENK